MWKPENWRGRKPPPRWEEDVPPADAEGEDPLLLGHLLTPPLRDAPTRPHEDACPHLPQLQKAERENADLRRRLANVTRRYHDVRQRVLDLEHFWDELISALAGAATKAGFPKHDKPSDGAPTTTKIIYPRTEDETVEKRTRAKEEPR
ncbi:hypothetical protein VSH64_37075 [Amycolatopsis rhabdoformis]|uniref:Transposase n=1 Tax=Amycolatopsis rhabdoformis TaxID=1448059 RepID=A0ABZ1I203_9PSEU|nr:hypothetical protein [Amycolatopsis rhabdoformis]WSE28409.1 hypothetical protein VSH64_37075 [Amycolatopsis rhabdoformis]